MIQIKRKNPGNQWKKWLDDALIEKKKVAGVVRQGNKPKFKNIWRDFKPYLEEIFFEKCGYCETNIISGTWLAVEHYRPKGKVTKDNSPKSIVKIRDAKNNEIPHPGYYWLAYDWKNYFLSCDKCNSPPGKGTQFPIEGVRACSKNDSLADERALLLNPLIDDPREHLQIGKYGYLEGKTVRGRVTIRICNLNRIELQKARQTTYNDLKYKIAIKFLEDPTNDPIADVTPFSFYLREAFKELAKKMHTTLSR